METVITGPSCALHCQSGTVPDVLHVWQVVEHLSIAKVGSDSPGAG